MSRANPGRPTQQAVGCRQCKTLTGGRTWCLLRARACRLLWGECCSTLSMDPLLEALIAPATCGVMAHWLHVCCCSASAVNIFE